MKYRRNTDDSTNEKTLEIFKVNGAFRELDDWILAITLVYTIVL